MTGHVKCPHNGPSVEILPELAEPSQRPAVWEDVKPQLPNQGGDASVVRQGQDGNPTDGRYRLSLRVRCQPLGDLFKGEDQHTVHLYCPGYVWPGRVGMGKMFIPDMEHQHRRAGLDPGAIGKREVLRCLSPLQPDQAVRAIAELKNPAGPPEEPIKRAYQVPHYRRPMRAIPNATSNVPAHWDEVTVS